MRLRPCLPQQRPLPSPTTGLPHQSWPPLWHSQKAVAERCGCGHMTIVLLVGRPAAVRSADGVKEEELVACPTHARASRMIHCMRTATCAQLRGMHRAAQLTGRGMHRAAQLSAEKRNVRAEYGGTARAAAALLLSIVPTWSVAMAIMPLKEGSLGAVKRTGERSA